MNSPNIIANARIDGNISFLFFHDSTFSKFNAAKHRGIEIRYPRKINENISNNTGIEDIASKIIGSIEWTDGNNYLFLNNNKIVRFTYHANSDTSTFDSLQDTASKFPGLAGVESEIMATFSTPSTSGGIEYIVLLTNNRVLSLNANDGTGLVEAFTILNRGFAWEDYHNKVTSILKQNDGTYHFFLTSGAILNIRKKRDEFTWEQVPGLLPEISNLYPGLGVWPENPWYSIDLVSLKCDDTSEGLDDEVLLTVELGIYSITNRNLSTRNMLTAREIMDEGDLWHINQRLYFKKVDYINPGDPIFGSVKILVVDEDITTKDDKIGSLIINAKDIFDGDIPTNPAPKKFSGDSSDYLLRYVLQNDYSANTLFIGSTFYNEKFRVGTDRSKHPIRDVLIQMEEEMLDMREKAISGFEHFNETKQKDLEEKLKSAALGLAFDGAAVGAGMAAAVYIGSSGAAAAAAGLLVTGGVVVVGMAVIAAIALPIYFANVKSAVSILIANNTDVDLELETLVVNDGFQTIGGLPGSRNIPGYLIPAASHNRELVSLGFFGFEKFRTLFALDGSLTFKGIGKNGHLLKRLTINFEVAANGSGGDNILTTRLDANIKLRHSSEMDSIDSDIPTMIISLDQVIEHVNPLRPGQWLNIQSISDSGFLNHKYLVDFDSLSSDDPLWSIWRIEKVTGTESPEIINYGDIILLRNSYKRSYLKGTLSASDIPTVYPMIADEAEAYRCSIRKSPTEIGIGPVGLGMPVFLCFFNSIFLEAQPTAFVKTLSFNSGRLQQFQWKFVDANKLPKLISQRPFFIKTVGNNQFLNAIAGISTILPEDKEVIKFCIWQIEKVNGSVSGVSAVNYGDVIFIKNSVNSYLKAASKGRANKFVIFRSLDEHTIDLYKWQIKKSPTSIGTGPVRCGQPVFLKSFINQVYLEAQLGANPISLSEPSDSVPVPLSFQWEFVVS